MNNWKKLAAAVILAGAVVMIQGCGGNGEEAKSMEKGRVWKAATEAAYPPFRYVDENRNLVGFEVDLLKEIGRRTGATIEFRDMPFDRLLDTVAGKQVDMAIGAITVTKEREKLVAFSDSYYRLSGYSLLAKKEIRRCGMKKNWLAKWWRPKGDLPVKPGQKPKIPKKSYPWTIMRTFSKPWKQEKRTWAANTEDGGPKEQKRGMHECFERQLSRLQRLRTGTRFIR